MGSMTEVIIEAGLTELIDANDAEVALDEYSKDANVTVGVDRAGSTQPINGEIQAVALYASESGTGAVMANSGKILFFDADPALSAGDAALASAAVHQTLIAQVEVDATEWNSDALGAGWYKEVALPFHDLSAIYFAFRNEGAAINSAAGDDEELHINFWYRRFN